MSYINYPELIESSSWGDDRVLIDGDINLLAKTDFNAKGFQVLSINNVNVFLRELLRKKIFDVISKEIDIEKYHSSVTEEEHRQILNSMPYKKSDIRDFCEYLEAFISEQLKEKVKIFNDDIWVRICRPNTVSSEDDGSN